MIPTSFLGNERRDTDADRTARRRSAAVSSAFDAAPSGLDFNKRAPAAPSSGMNGSFLDLYGSTSFKQDMAQREERAAQMDRLPAPVQQLVQSRGVTDLDLLTAVRAGSVCLNSFGAVAKWISALVMPQPGLAAVR